jgi:hypothetical protein
MQTNVPTGTTLRRTAGADLSAKKDFIVMLDGSDEIQLHDGSLKTPYILLENTDDTKEGSVQALNPNEPVRVKSASAHVKHAPVYLDVATGKATPTASAIRLGFALEAKADTSEGSVAIRPDPAIAPVGTLALLAQDISATYVEAEVQAISTKVDALIALVQKAR